MASAIRPTVRELDQRDIKAVLARNNVGRIAFTSKGQIEIRPIHYVFSRGAIYGRTSEGGLVSGRNRSQMVAFEVDEVESTLRWRSVIVHGAVEPLTATDAGDEWDGALRALRLLTRAAFTVADPFPHRSVLFRIRADRISGRAMDAPRLSRERERPLVAAIL